MGEMGRLELANCKAEFQYSVNCGSSALELTQLDRVGIARDAHQKATPIGQVAKI